MASKRSQGLILLILLMVPFFSLPFNSVHADEPTPIGFEFLDGGEVLRIWNLYDSYYFNTSSGVQFSNHYNEYWSRNILQLGYYSGGAWNLIYSTDSLGGFKKDLNTDFDTYLNITLWKDLSYAAYDFRLAIQYHLKLRDIRLTVIPYIKNLGQAIPFDIGFGWKIEDIKASFTEENDWFEVWENEVRTDVYDSYYLNGTINETYKDGNFTGYCITDTETKEFLELRWDYHLNNKLLLKVNDGPGQYNAPVTLYIIHL